jgi:DNA-binding PadR family transcriptional regulator
MSHWRHRYGGFGEAWGPWGQRGRFFGPGEVRLAILSLLGESPKHGYEIIKEFEARSGGLYRASPGVVYPTLQMLEDEGLVAAEQQDGRRVYRLTDAGREEVARESDAIGDIWHRAERWNDWGKWMGPEAAVIGPTVAAFVKAAFGAATRAVNNPDLTERVRQILDQARRDLEKVGAR